VAVVVDLSPNGRKIDVHFTRYERGQAQKIKALPGAAWRANDGVWRLPLNLATGRELRRLFENELQLTPSFRSWAANERRKERSLRAMALNLHTDAEDLRINSTHRELCQYLRPYQRAGVQFLATGDKLNCDDMGLGKTVTVLAALVEQGLDIGFNLIIAPKTSVDSVWGEEITRWLPYANVVDITGDTPATARQPKLIESTFVVTTAAMFRSLEWMLEVDWNAFVLDEFHQTGLTQASARHDKGSLFFQRAIHISARRRYGMSGTPMGGQPIRLWGAFHWLDARRYSSKWQWAKHWLTVSNNGFGQVIGDIRPDREDEFYKAHAQDMLRRKKEDVLTELPPKQHVPVICSMLPAQRRQYRKFQQEAELIISDEHLIATSRLAELARLKAFASAECTATRNVKTGKLKLHPDFSKGGKAQQLLDRLIEGGVDAGERQAIVATQFREVADSIFEYLSMRDFRCVKITGGVGGKARTEAIRNFQKDDSYSRPAQAGSFSGCLFGSTVPPGMTLTAA
jgi:SNF2 family DNA or RNA helicase